MARSRTNAELVEHLSEMSIPVPWSGCAIWLGGIDKDGYGQSSMNNKNVRSHRLAYMLHVGEIPAGMVVMHSCDIPCCINPSHLSLGTNAENTRDKINKGRDKYASGESHYMRKTPKTRAGEKSPTAILKGGDVEEIRKMLNEGVSQSEIAKNFGVSRSCVSAISTNRNWN